VARAVQHGSGARVTQALRGQRHLVLGAILYSNPSEPWRTSVALSGFSNRRSVFRRTATDLSGRLTLPVYRKVAGSSPASGATFLNTNSAMKQGDGGMGARNDCNGDCNHDCNGPTGRRPRSPMGSRQDCTRCLNSKRRFGTLWGHDDSITPGQPTATRLWSCGR
jgi:hypothetical protein